MQKQVISIKPDDNIAAVIRQMRKYEISQVIVIDNNKLMGFVSEKDVLDAFMQGKKSLKAKDIMEDSPPTITKDASMTLASDMLKTYPIVVVVEKGKNIGVVTKSDVLGKVYRSGLF
jgi:cystathionine beta-synthase